MTTFITGSFMKEATKTKMYRGKRYYLHTITNGDSANKIGKALTNEKIPNLQVPCRYDRQSMYAIYVR
jgi:hypothetical protein